jgi:uncharacterized iron-regulated protein
MVCEGGAPADCHEYCQITEANAPASAVRAYADVLKAADEGDSRTIAALQKEIPAYVFVNRQRKAIQVLDCRSEWIVASIPLATEELP